MDSISTNPVWGVVTSEAYYYYGIEKERLEAGRKSEGYPLFI